ncbi:MAG: PilC/PilY family type IV pilus protein [Pseudomonadota bacterium]
MKKIAFGLSVVFVCFAMLCCPASKASGADEEMTGAPCKIFKMSVGNDIKTHVVSPSFVWGDWTGKLTCMMYDNSDLTGGQQRWTTTLPGSRNIYAGVCDGSGCSKVEFTTSNKDALGLSDYGWGDAADIDAKITKIREAHRVDDHPVESSIADIINSAPVYVGPPMGGYGFKDEDDDGQDDVGYQTFKADHSDRTKMIYVGANDGMLHVFGAEDGVEKWAYIPTEVLPNLPAFNSDASHHYSVDLTPVIADVQTDINAPDSWKTVLIGGCRLGGREVFCLDITDPDPADFAVIWDKMLFPEPSSEQMSKSSTIPRIGKIKHGSNDCWVAIITSGYDESGNTGKLAALNIANGEPVFTFGLGAKDENFDYYTPTSPEAVDSDDDGYFDLIYVGDVNGKLWKFSYYDSNKEDAINGNWNGGVFCQAGQSITSKPLLVFDKTNANISCRKLRVFFGTGRLIMEKDKLDPLATSNSFYCIVEEKDAQGYYSSASVNMGDLVDITSASLDTGTELEQYLATDQAIYNRFYDIGWKFNFSGSSERVVTDPTAASKVVFFTSFNPNNCTQTFCGSSRLYAVDYITGVEAKHGGLPVIDFKPSQQPVHDSHPRYTDLTFGGGIAFAPQINREPSGSSIQMRTANPQSGLFGGNTEIKLNIDPRIMWLKSWKRN